MPSSPQRISSSSNNNSSKSVGSSGVRFNEKTTSDRYSNNRYSNEGGYRSRSGRNYDDEDDYDRRNKDRKSYRGGRRDYDDDYDREKNYSKGNYSRYEKYDRYADDDRKKYSDDYKRDDRSSRYKDSHKNSDDHHSQREHSKDKTINNTNENNETLSTSKEPQQQESTGEVLSKTTSTSDLNNSLKRKMEEHQQQQKRKKMGQEKYDTSDKGEEFIGLNDDSSDSVEDKIIASKSEENSIQKVAEQLWTDEKDFILKPTSIDELIELNKVHVLRKEQYEKKLEKLEKKKDKKKSSKKRKHKEGDEIITSTSTTNQEEEVGPKLLPDMTQDKDTRYEVPLLPGEGAAIAEFIQQNKRIPRRGEVGLTSEQITDYENLGYVMSGSRHARMNAIRIMKENEVYMQEEKKRLALLSKQERSQRENKIISQFRDIAKRE
ncbi:hypothetical protein C9374_011922 [Naegleria lovaniensis]|uniref:NF-kappa-B-activating protein C-terminal domain-containing protein n=1 Tax=Naegleria lovaniensis TaxID=51637 RepID=A0AA88GEY6_NAELO|nr:uncharacterized protein C9374_011922 [Naegleria lovaniensis]KAG2373633.1 hypothetical protein C9374_011922 [Naegleria lovaniensis]